MNNRPLVYDVDYKGGIQELKWTENTNISDKQHEDTQANKMIVI